MVGKSPEEKAAQRRAAFERRVAQTAAREAERKAAVNRETEVRKANHAAAIAAKARSLSEQGRPFTFKILGVSVLDGVVYVAKGGLRRLGPLAGASADVKRIPEKVIHRSFANQLIFGNPAIKKRARVTLTVETAESIHRDVAEQQIEGSGFVQRAEREAKDFNELVRLANARPRRRPHGTEG
jgi:hypothetical protein